MDNSKLDDLEEFVWRWKNHYKMLNDIQKTNIDEKKIKIWKNQIDNCFYEKLKLIISNRDNLS